MTKTILAILLATGLSDVQAAMDSSASTAVLASQAGAALDSDLLKGGGTDDTAALQRILDRAKDGRGVHLIIDGPALISGLEVHGRTTVECTAGGGLFLKDNSPRAMLRNAHRSATSVTDRHIAIRGCFFNGNRHRQAPLAWPAGAKAPQKSVREPDGTYRSVLQFFGVHYLTIENVTIWQNLAWASLISNAKFVEIRNILIDGNITPYPEGTDATGSLAWLKKNAIGPEGSASGGDDGLHFSGPIQYLTIEGAKLRTWDDGLAFTANLSCGEVTDKALKDTCLAWDYASPYTRGGPISDVAVNNVLFMDGHHGIRLLSGDDRIDRVVISNVAGTVRERFAVLSPFFPGRTGNIGSVTFSHVNVDVAPFPSWSQLRPEWGLQKLLEEQERTASSGSKVEPHVLEGLVGAAKAPLISLNAKIETLRLQNIATRTADPNQLLVWVGPGAHIHTLHLDLSVHDAAASAPAVPIELMGEIEHLNLALDWAGQEPIRYLGGRIGRWSRMTPGKSSPSPRPTSRKKTAKDFEHRL